MVIIVKRTVLINKPIWFASFQALYEEWSQNIWEIRFIISPYSGNFIEIRRSHPTEKNTSQICMIVFFVMRNFLFKLKKLWIKVIRKRSWRTISFRYHKIHFFEVIIVNIITFWANKYNRSSRFYRSYFILDHHNSNHFSNYTIWVREHSSIWEEKWFFYTNPFFYIYLNRHCYNRTICK